MSRVTLGELCDGTSGIGSYTPQLLSLWIANPTRTWDPRELASYGLGQQRTTAPGDAYIDSDAGYLLLGLALERATGQSASALIEQYVVDPLDLTATQLPAPAAVESGGRRAGAHRPPLDAGGRRPRLRRTP